MKKELLLFLIFLLSCSVYSQEKLLASCCDGKEGRCTGSAYCSACTNCSRCKHCAAGGTCGVCTSYSAPVKQKSSNKKDYKSSSSTSKKSSFKSPSEYSVGNYLMVTSETLNLRQGPGVNYDVIEKLYKKSLLVFISYEGEWIKVKVYGSGRVGYVNYKYVE